MAKIKCEVSPLFGRDENKELHFYCEYCGEEMSYNEDRVCKSKRKKMAKINKSKTGSLAINSISCLLFFIQFLKILVILSPHKKYEISFLIKLNGIYNLIYRYVDILYFIRSKIK